jgi:hypothetical protein
MLRTIKPILLLASLALMFTSCQKEVSVELGTGSGGSGSGGGTGTGGSGNTNNITGSYNFVGLAAHTKSTASATEGGVQETTVTVSDYVTTDNVGTVTFSANQMSANNLGYSIDTLLNVKTYENGTLVDDSDVPFSVTIPPMSSTSPYVRISADSITVTGSVISTSDPSGTTPTGPVGVKLSWSGDTLIMKSSIKYSKVVDQGGVSVTLDNEATSTWKLKKKS